MGNFIPKSTPIKQDIYITCLDKMEKGYATPSYHTETCNNCKLNIHYNFVTTNLVNKHNCFNCESNYKDNYTIDIHPISS